MPDDLSLTKAITCLPKTACGDSGVQETSGFERLVRDNLSKLRLERSKFSRCRETKQRGIRPKTIQDPSADSEGEYGLQVEG